MRMIAGQRALVRERAREREREGAIQLIENKLIKSYMMSSERQNSSKHRLVYRGFSLAQFSLLALSYVLLTRVISLSGLSRSASLSQQISVCICYHSIE